MKSTIKYPVAIRAQDELENRAITASLKRQGFQTHPTSRQVREADGKHGKLDSKKSSLSDMDELRSRAEDGFGLSLRDVEATVGSMSQLSESEQLEVSTRRRHFAVLAKTLFASSQHIEKFAADSDEPKIHELDKLAARVEEAASQLRAIDLRGVDVDAMGADELDLLRLSFAQFLKAQRSLGPAVVNHLKTFAANSKSERAKRAVSGLLAATADIVKNRSHLFQPRPEITGDESLTALKQSLSPAIRDRVIAFVESSRSLMGGEGFGQYNLIANARVLSASVEARWDDLKATAGTDNPEDFTASLFERSYEVCNQNMAPLPFGTMLNTFQTIALTRMQAGATDEVELFDLAVKRAMDTGRPLEEVAPTVLVESAVRDRDPNALAPDSIVETRASQSLSGTLMHPAFESVTEEPNLHKRLTLGVESFLNFKSAAEEHWHVKAGAHAAADLVDYTTAVAAHEALPFGEVERAVGAILPLDRRAFPSTERMGAVVHYQRAHNVSYQEAVEKVRPYEPVV